jgi:hypothetical protein
VVISGELARLGGDNANALILRELSNGVIAGTYAVAIAALIAATTPIPSSGDVLADLAALLAAVPSGSSSRLFFVIEPSQAKTLATLSGVRRSVPADDRQWWPDRRGHNFSFGSVGCRNRSAVKARG